MCVCFIQLYTQSAQRHKSASKIRKALVLDMFLCKLLNCFGQNDGNTVYKKMLCVENERVEGLDVLHSPGLDTDLQRLSVFCNMCVCVRRLDHRRGLFMCLFMGLEQTLGSGRPHTNRTL